MQRVQLQPLLPILRRHRFRKLVWDSLELFFNDEKLWFDYFLAWSNFTLGICIFVLLSLNPIIPLVKWPSNFHSSELYIFISCWLIKKHKYGFKLNYLMYLCPEHFLVSTCLDFLIFSVWEPFKNTYLFTYQHTRFDFTSLV